MFVILLPFINYLCTTKMFTLPPRPPKDYVIKDVTKSLQSSSDFTPDSEIRVTQPNLAKFCSPIEYTDDETPEKSITPIEPSILNKMTNNAKAEWIPAPGKDGFLLNEVYRKYSFPPMNYDPRFRNMEKVFNRSYYVEADCVEARRMDRVADSVERNLKEFEEPYQRLVEKKIEKEKPRIKVRPAKIEPPFWWKISMRDNEDEEAVKQGDVKDTTYRFSYPGWQEEPNLTAFIKDDPCLRKKEMNRVGQPFRTEACNWYYKTYPSPDIKFIPKKFIPI